MRNPIRFATTQIPHASRQQDLRQGSPGPSIQWDWLAAMFQDSFEELPVSLFYDITVLTVPTSQNSAPGYLLIVCSAVCVPLDDWKGHERSLHFASFCIPSSSHHFWLTGFGLAAGSSFAKLVPPSLPFGKAELAPCASDPKKSMASPPCSQK